MATNIRLKSSSVSNKVPTLSDLSLRELAVNTTDGRLFLRKGNGTGSDVIVDVTDHGSFYGLADDDHTQYLHSTITRTGVTAELNTAGKITTTSAIGIGTTTPIQKLTIVNAAKSVADGSLFSLSSSDATNAFQLLISRTAAGAGSCYAIQSVEQNVDFRNLSLNPNGGNVGIGISNPESKTHIAVSSIGVITALTLDNTSGAAVGADFKVNYGGYATSRIVFDFVGGQFGSGSHGMNYVSGRTNFSNHWFRNASNATQMVMNNSGNLLIGTETDSGTASQRLQVTGGAYISGNVGIGTTNPINIFDVKTSLGRVTISSAGSGGTRINFMQANGTLRGTISNFGGGEEILAYDVADNHQFLISGSPKLIINSAGNVGIGTLTPANLLELKKDTAAFRQSSVSESGGYVSTFGLNWSTTNTFIIDVNPTGASTTRIFNYGSNGNLTLNYASTSTSRAFIITDGVSERLRVNSSGNVGIGTTNPSSRLTSIDNIEARDSSGWRGIKIENTGSPQSIIKSINYLGAGYEAQLRFQTMTGTTTTDAMSIVGSGNIGIGTTNPGTPLDVIGDIRSSTALRTIKGQLADEGGGVLLQTTGYLRINNGNSEFIRLSSAGNLGIGTTNPLYKLDVTGPIRYTDGQINSTFTFERTFNTVSIGAFVDGVANQAFDIRLGNISMWGYIEVEITGTFSFQSTAGILRKVFTFGVLPSNNIALNESRVAEAMGAIVDNISIGEFQWDATNTTYKIPISHIVSTGNYYVVKIRGFSYGNAQAIYDNLSLSAVYTLTALPKNDVTFPTRNVLIGTQTPTGTASQPLQVTGGAYISGKLGIGTTTVASGEQVQVVGGGLRAQSLNAVGTAGAFAATGGIIAYHNGSGVGILRAYSDAGGGSGTLILNASGSEDARINSSGNVGIGTTNPSTRLHVSGSVRIADASTASLFISRSSNTVTAQHFYTPSTDSPWYLYGENLTWTGERIGTTRRAERAYYEAFAPAVGRKEFGFVNKASADTAFISTDLIPSLVLKNNGTVGIGTTDPTELLSLYGSTGTTFGVSLTPDGWNSARHRFIVPIQGNSSMLSWNYNGSVVDSSLYATSAVFVQNGIISLATGTFNTAPVDRLVVNSTGNVGIGTTNPGNKLHIYSASGTSRIRIDSGSDSSFIGFDGSTADLQLASSTNIKFQTGASYSEVARVTSGGNVGIGTTNPLTKLDVRGVITAGSASATGGAEILRGYYDAGALTVIGSEYSSGAPVIGYAVKPSTTNTESFLSSTSITVGRSACMLRANYHAWYFGAVQTVAENSAVTMGEVMRLTSSGNLGIGTTNPGGKLHAFIDANAQLIFQNVSQNNLYVSGTNASLVLDSKGSSYPGIFIKTQGVTNGIITNIDGQTSSSGISLLNGSGSGLVINSSGNVGIATTNPSYRLSVLGDAGRFVDLTGNVVQVRLAATEGGWNSLVGFASNSGTFLGGMLGNGIGQSMTDLRLGVGSSPNSVVINSSGNVGIGITNPLAYGTASPGNYKIVATGSGTFGYNFLTGNSTVSSNDKTGYQSIITSLAVSGGKDVVINGVTTGRMRINIAWSSSSGTSFGYMIIEGSTYINSSGTGYTLSNYRIIDKNFQNGTYYSITENPDVAITSPTGNTSADKVTLTIRGADGLGSLYATVQVETWGSYYLSNANSISLSLPGTTTSTSYLSDVRTFWTSNQERVRIDATGNVGIGTTNPLAKLHVESGVNSDVLRLTSTNAEAQLRFFHNAGTTYTTTLGSQTLGVDNVGLVFRTGTGGGSNRMAIDVNGNVGIGTTNPQAKLDVNGNVLPTTDATHNLGSPTKRWNNVYTTDLQLSNEGSHNDVDGTWGAYTIQEGEEDLFLINRRNGKKYKFVLQEVN